MSDDQSERIPVFTGIDDATQWWAARLRRQGFHVFCDGAVGEHGAAFLLERTPKTLANWRSMGMGPAYRRRGPVVYLIPDLIRWDRDESARAA